MQLLLVRRGWMLLLLLTTLVYVDLLPLMVIVSVGAGLGNGRNPEVMHVCVWAPHGSQERVGKRR